MFLKKYDVKLYLWKACEEIFSNTLVNQTLYKGDYVHDIVREIRNYQKSNFKR